MNSIAYNREIPRRDLARRIQANGIKDAVRRWYICFLSLCRFIDTNIIVGLKSSLCHSAVNVYLLMIHDWDITRKNLRTGLSSLKKGNPTVTVKNKSTEKIIEQLKDDNDDKVDQRAVLKARLLDMFIMDFDRHEDQWRWNTKDTGTGKLYYPLPRDRDQAFS